MIVNNLEISNYNFDSENLPVFKNISIEIFTINACDFSALDVNISEWLKVVLSHKIKYLSFNNCIFEKDFYLGNSEIKDLSFSTCIFKEKIRLIGINKDFGGDKFLLTNCTFEKEFDLSFLTIKTLSFAICTFKENIRLTHSSGEKFQLTNCTVEKDLYFRDLIINCFDMRDSKANNQLHLENCQCNIELNKSTFEGKVTLLSNKFKDLKFFHSIFKEVVDFSSTSFGGIIKIADSTFKEGINLYNTSFFENEEKYPLEGFKKYFKTIEKDLVKADVLSNFRASMNILKNSLDNAHNYIDGNKFYALEILAHRNHLREYLKDELKNKVKEKDRTACRKLLNYIYNPSITIDFLLIKLNSCISSNYQNTAKALFIYIFIIPFLAISVEIIKWEYFSWSWSNWSDFFFLWQEITFPFNYATKPKEDISIWFNIFRAFETYVLWQIIRSSMRNFKR